MNQRISRRRFIAAAGAAGGTMALLSQCSSRNVEQMSLSTATVRAEGGTLFGSALSIADLDSTVPIAELVGSRCGIVATSGPLYWQRVQPERGRFAFANAERILAFAAQAGVPARGHTLVWHLLTPTWVHEARDRTTTRAILQEHIGTVVRHFRGRIHSWDVVNEPLEPGDGRADGLRTSPFLETLGPDYIGVAMRAAREADPDALLGVNEYGLEGDRPSHAARREAMMALLARLRTEGAPLDYLGIQGHLVGGDSYSVKGLGTFIARVRDLGVRVLVTELDVDDSSFGANISERDAAVADVYDRFLTVALGHGPIDAVLTWGLCDRSSWLQSRAPRKDGLAQRPLPFDDELRPKRAWDVLRAHLGLPSVGASEQGLIAG
jgi:endo-1,4-beta-xylanase